MADEIDIANDLIDNEVSRALSKMRKHHETVSKNVKHCIGCGENIPSARQKLGFVLCVPCAQEAERSKALFIE